MKLLYVAKFGQTASNRDEEAIAHAFRVLGHEVVCLDEQPAREKGAWPTANLCIFHKWYAPEALKQIECPKAFWFFDRVSDPDPMLARRCATRKAWMDAIIPLVDIGFATDGDFVARDKTGKLYWLPQGADERVAGFGTPGPERIPILFTGSVIKCGRKRESFVAEMTARYGSRFVHVAGGVHGRALADLIASADIVVAPDGPIGSQYWSNRLWLTLGFGGVLLHPACDGLCLFYFPDELMTYQSRDGLHNRIADWRRNPNEAAEFARRGYERTMHDHLYQHRVEQLLRTVKERL